MGTNIAVFFNIVQKGGEGGQAHVKKKLLQIRKGPLGWHWLSDSGMDRHWSDLGPIKNYETADILCVMAELKVGSTGGTGGGVKLLPMV